MSQRESQSEPEKVREPDLTSLARFVAKQLNTTLFCRQTLEYGTFCRETLKYSTFVAKRKNTRYEPKKWHKLRCDELKGYMKVKWK